MQEMLEAEMMDALQAQKGERSALNNSQLVVAEGFFVFAKHCKILVPGE